MTHSAFDEDALADDRDAGFGDGETTGQVAFAIKAGTRPVPASGLLTVTANATSSSAEADPGNNEASYNGAY